MANRVVPKDEPGWLPGPATPFAPLPGPSLMRRLNTMDHAQVIAYNLRDGGRAYTEFEVAQADRVAKARAIIAKVTDGLVIERYIPRVDPLRLLIVEPGCSTGDISGFFSDDHNVIGIDVVPAAAAAARKKWPKMQVLEERIENIEPIDCDVLVLCEFLEHITDPVAFVTRWLPRARYVVIGHPLVGDGTDPEEGHPWAYYDVDFANWFHFGGHELVEAWEFPMGYRMVIGWGQRV